MGSTLNIVLDFVFRLATLLFLMRFLLQASGANFYNPISQAIVKATDPVCKPVRLALKSYGNFDFASLFVAWVISVIAVFAFTIMFSGSAPPVLSALWAGLIKTLLVLIQFYKWTIIIIVIASFVAQGTHHPALALLNEILEPLMGRVRKVMPNFGLLDLSPMVVLLIIIVVEDILARSYF
jgi:YggT family protein